MASLPTAQSLLSGPRLLPDSVLAVTAHAMANQLAEFKAAGFTGHVAKPLRSAALRAALFDHAGAARAGAQPDAPAVGAATVRGAALDELET